MHVVNVAPTIAISGAANVNEGSPYSLTLGAVTDPGTDTVSSWIVHWGDGRRDTYASNGAKSHTYADGPDDHAITVDLVDEDGTFLDRANALSVHVNNVAPTVTLSAGNDLSVAEGSTRTYSYTINDPGTDTVTSVTTSCSGTGSKVTLSDTFNNTSGSFDCSFADGPNSSTVSASATDDDGDTGTADTQSVTVNNVAPTVTLSNLNDLSVNEGSTHSYSYTITDPGVDTVSSVTTSCSGTGSKVALSDTFTNANGSFDCSFADGPNSSTVSASATDDDADTGAADTQSVTVNNVAPSIAISGAASVNEGSAYSLTLGAVTDPGDDTVTSWIVHWGDGNSNTYSTDGAKSHTYADGDNNYNVTVDLVDEDGTFLDRANAHSVQVDNVAPSIAISGAASVNEGSSYSLTLGAVTDPGTDTVSSYVVHWGDGNSNTYATNGDKTHTYADGPDNHSITVDLVDEDGTFLDRANALSVHVNNVAPTVALSAGNDLSVNESGVTEHTYSYSISDPGIDNVSSVSTSCGANGDKVLGSDTNTNSSGSFKCTFPDGSATTSSTVSVNATDDDGDTGNTDTQSVSVANVAPTAHLSGPTNVDEGSTHTYTFTVTDPGVDTFTVNTPAYPDCGSGGNYVAGSLATNLGGGSFDCTFPDGPTSTDVKIRVTDSDGASDTDTENVVVVAVANLDPVVTLTGPSPVAEGSTHTYSYTTTDDGTPETFSRDAQSCDGGTLSAPLFNSATGAGSFDCTYADGPRLAQPERDRLRRRRRLRHRLARGHGHERRSDDRDQRRSERQRGLGLQPDPGRGHRSGHRHGQRLHRPLGRRQRRHLRDRPAPRRTPTPTAPNHDVTVDLIDEDGTFLDRANAKSVTVDNVAPSIAISGDANVNEGSAYTLTLGAVTDPGTDTVSSYIVHWGDGSIGHLRHERRQDAHLCRRRRPTTT